MSPKIPEFLALRKGAIEALYLPLIVVLVGLAAFGLGRLSAEAGSNAAQCQTL